MYPEEIIAEKYDELIKRVNETHSTENFTGPERVIWLLVSIRREIDINSFEDVFIQLLPPADIAEAIGYMRELRLKEIADMFQRALDLLEGHNFDPHTDDYDALPEHVLDTMEEFNRQAWKTNRSLWGIDQQLCDMLDRE